MSGKCNCLQKVSISRSQKRRVSTPLDPNATDVEIQINRTDGNVNGSAGVTSYTGSDQENESQVAKKLQDAKDEVERLGSEIAETKSHLVAPFDNEDLWFYYYKVDLLRFNLIDSLTREMQFRKERREALKNVSYCEQEQQELNMRISTLRAEMEQWMTKRPCGNAAMSGCLEKWETENRRMDQVTNILQQTVAQINTFLVTIPKVNPDSQRLDVILPQAVDAQSGELYFVNREESTIGLIKFHFSTYYTRDSAGTGGLEYPLMDALFGMGKSCFSKKYLGMVARLYHKYPDSNVLYEKIYGGTNFQSRQKFESFLNELKMARTLYVSLPRGCLRAKSSDASIAIISCLHEALVQQWGVTLEKKSVFLRSFIGQIPKPVFIVLDEVGAAFDLANDTRHLKDEFIDFLQKVCNEFARQHGVYYLLSGRAPFLMHVGLRPDHNTFQTSPGTIVRIRLNSIRKDYIGEILQRTYSKNGCTYREHIETAFPAIPLQNMIDQIYRLTGGHPRSLFRYLDEGKFLDELPDADLHLLLDDVRRALIHFPCAIRSLYNDRNKRDIDLTVTIDLPDNTKVSRAFLASFLHAGIGVDIKSCHLTIMPPIQEYLDFYFQPFMDYLLQIERHVGRDTNNKSRMFEELLLRWFHSVFADPSTTFAEKLGRFCPSGSILGGSRWMLDPTKLKNGLRVLSNNKRARSTETISGANHSVDVYLPALTSCSPDILIIPQIPDTDNLFIIGVQAKCFSEKPMKSLNAEDVLEEAKKLHDILVHVRSESAKNVKGILLMCGTCKYTKKDFPPI